MERLIKVVQDKKGIDFPNKNASSLKNGALPAANSPRTLFFARDLNKLSVEPATVLIE